MNYHRNIKKVIAVFLCTVLCFGVFSSSALNVHAASNNISLEQVLDIALTKVGYSANSSFLQKTQASVLNMLNGTASSYSNYCEANALDKNKESWAQYLNSDAYASLGYALPNFILQLADIITWMIKPEDYVEEMEQRQAIVQALAGTVSCVQGETYLISDEAVEFVYDVFNDVINTEGLGYYYVSVFDVDTMDLGLFSSIDDYNDFKSYVKSSDYPTLTYVYYKNGNIKGTYILDNRELYFLVRDGSVDQFVNTYFIGSDWNYKNVKYVYNTNPYYWVEFNDGDTFGNFSDQYHTANVGSLGVSVFYKRSLTQNGYMNYYAADPGRMIVFKTLEDLKMYSVGQRPYYVTSNTYYDSNNDYSVSVTGDYLINNGGSLSYDTIYNEIVNQNDYSENVINEIVNSNNQTIINNYYYTDPDAGGSGGSGDGGNSGSGGGLSSIIDGIGSILNFIINLIGDLLGLIGGFLNTLYDMLSNLAGSFTQFSGLMGELFTFIPKELMDLITSAIGVVIVLAVWHFVRR